MASTNENTYIVSVILNISLLVAKIVEEIRTLANNLVIQID